MNGGPATDEHAGGSPPAADRGRGRSAAPWIVAGLIVAADAFISIRSAADLDRLLINLVLALSAFATLHARMLSLATAGFMAIGAYASAILTVKVGLPVEAALLAALGLCALVALLIGLPVLRLTDVYLAISTLGFGEVVRILIVVLADLTGGPTGANLSTGFPYDAMKRIGPGAIAAALALLVYLFWSMSRSRTGRALRAIRERPAAAASMGIDLMRYRTLAFVMSAIIAGAAGAFYAHSVGSLDNSDFRFNRAVDVLGYAVLGGSGQWFGPLLGAGLLTALPLLLRDSLGASIGFLRGFAQLPNILTGLSLVLVIVFFPGGLAAVFPPRRARARGRAAASIGAALPGPLPPRSPSAGGEPLLVVAGLSRAFGGVAALGGVDLRFERGVIHGLIGPNGAGKTTLLNLISGAMAPTTGSILWQGREIAGRRPHEIAQAGIARTWQGVRLFDDMTVRDNVLAGHHARMGNGVLATWLSLPRSRRQEQAAAEEANGLLERLGLGGFADRAAGTLSYGDRRRVEIARALALEPQLLLLDEPAAGMNGVEAEALGTFLVELKHRGYTLIVVEHHMELIMRVCDRIAVLNFGRTIAQGTPAEVASSDAVREAYLGRD